MLSCAGVALCPPALRAQVAPPPPPRDAARPDTIRDPIPPRPDSIRVDSSSGKPTARSAPGDSLPPRDTVKAPLARAELPRDSATGVGEAYRWTRAELFATGALNLADLLDRVPGVTTLRAGWVAAPMVAGYHGDVARVRVFYDGVELDPIDARTGGIVDLQTVPLWSAEEVAVERAAGELRVHVRSWRVERTTASTRTDVSTGDYDTNTYRAFFGKRFERGEVLQLAAQQFGTTDPSGGDGDALSLLTRVGWARARWSVDAFANRTHYTRSLKLRDFGFPPLPGMDATRTDAYVRGGYGDPDHGFWVQFIAASSRFVEASPRGGGGVFADSADSTRSRAQYVGSVGWSRAGLAASVSHRLRIFEGAREASPFARVAYDARLVSVAAFAERDGLRARDRVDVGATLRPLSFLAVSGAASQSRPSADDGGDGESATTVRGELGVRVGRLWVSGGLVRTDSAVLAAPMVFDTAYRPVAVGENTAWFAALRGRVFRAIFADVVVTRWDSATYYRPRYQARSELRLATRWLTRFPSGNFGVVAAGTHEYRSEMLYPVASGVQVASASSPFSTLLEIRIVSAVLFWQFRNIRGEFYDQVPGLRMPRQTSIYGVRWEFWN